MKKARLERGKHPRVRLGGRWYVIVPETHYQRLEAAALKAEGVLSIAVPGVPLPIDDSLARRLVERRIATGLTQAGLARRAGVRVETLNRIERGRTTPDFATIRKLVVVMNEASKSGMKEQR